VRGRKKCGHEIRRNRKERRSKRRGGLRVDEKKLQREKTLREGNLYAGYSGKHDEKKRVGGGIGISRKRPRHEKGVARDVFVARLSCERLKGRVRKGLGG